MMPLKDKEARTQAIENTTQNIIVEAGAGTGKTTLLVERILFLVFVKKVKLSRLVALTFTKKAAASLKQKLEENLYIAYHILLFNSFVLTAKEDKFEERLPEFSQKEQENFKKFRPLFLKSSLKKEQLFTLLKTALEEVPMCQIGTIHSFCNFLLKKYAVEAELSTNMNVDEAGLMDILFDKHWSLFLEDELILNNPSKEVWLNILKEVSLTDLKDFARSLCSTKFYDYNPKENYNFLKQKSQYYLNEAEILFNMAPENKKSHIKPLLQDCIQSLKQTIAFYKGENVIFEDINFHNTPQKKPSGWEDKDFDLAVQVANFAKNNIPKKQLILLQAYDLLKPFALKVRKEMLNQNYLTFDDIIYQTHSLLLKNKTVRQEIKLSYDNIFIDEFQDTDPIQGEIMLFICEKLDTFASKWQDLVLQQGKLFIVGDPKQSIYHFRGADISAYQEFCNLLKSQGALTCILQNNFRSAEKIITYVNAFGEDQIRFKQNRQMSYQPIFSSKQFDNARTELYLYDTKDKIDYGRNFAASVIAKWICDNVEKTNKSDGSPLEYKDIALLLPTATMLNVFLNALKEYNIPYNVEEDKNFYSSQEVLDLINILKVLKDPQNKIALLGILRGPICLVSDDILFSLSKENKLNIYTDIQNKKIQNLYQKLRILREKVPLLNPLEIVNEILEIFNFSVYQTLASSNEQVLANISKLKQVIAELVKNGSYTLEQLLDNFENYQKKNKEESSAILAEEKFNVVKILTIHKSKGLEYPVVILTDLSKSQNNNKTDKEDKEYYSRSLNLKGLMLGKIKDGVISLIEEDKKAQEFEEKKRLLYVAMTRAKEALIIVDKLETKDKTLSGLLSAASCWPDKEKKEQTLHSAKVFYLNYSRAYQQFREQNQERKSEFSFNYPAWQESYKKRKQEFEQYVSSNRKDINNPTLFPSPEVEHAIEVGTLCHKLLQNIFTGNSVSDISFEDKTALLEAKEIVSNFCKTPAFTKLKEMEFLASEFPVTILENGLVKNGIIDAIFKTKEGNIKIIDFKSDKIKVVTAATVEPKYLEQLSFYKTALSKVFKEEIETSLVYLRPAKIYNTEE